MSAYRSDNPSSSVQNVLLASATFDQTGAADGEASLDVQYTVCNLSFLEGSQLMTLQAGLVNNLDTVDYIVGPTLTTGNRYIEVFNKLATAAKHPTAISFSYGHVCLHAFLLYVHIPNLLHRTKQTPQARCCR
jgi:hypothetical protein